MNFLGKIPILKELEWFEWFEWFGPSPIEPFNSDLHRWRAVVALAGQASLQTGGDLRMHSDDPFDFDLGCLFGQIRVEEEGVVCLPSNLPN